MVHRPAEHGRRPPRPCAPSSRASAVPQRLHEVVLLGPDPLHGREGVGAEERRRGARPRSPVPRRGTGRSRRSVSPAASRWAALNSRTVSSIRKRTPDGVSATLSSDWSARCSRTSTTSPSPSTCRRGVGGEAAGEDRQRAQRRLPGRVEQVPAPVDDGVQRAVPLAARPGRRRAAARTGPPGGGRSRPPTCTRTRAAASSTASGSPSRWRHSSSHRVGGQVDAGPGRPGPLPEQLDRGRQAQLAAAGTPTPRRGRAGPGWW